MNEQKEGKNKYKKFYEEIKAIYLDEKRYDYEQRADIYNKCILKWQHKAGGYRDCEPSIELIKSMQENKQIKK